MTAPTLPRKKASGAPPGGWPVPRRYDHATYLDFGVKPFIGARCANCKAGLHDSAGNPRWDIVRGVVLVCQGWCRGDEVGN